jgi:hypothetical protein
MQKSSKNSNWKWVPGTGLRNLGKKTTNTKKNFENGTNPHWEELLSSVSNPCGRRSELFRKVLHYPLLRYVTNG